MAYILFISLGLIGVAVLVSLLATAMKRARLNELTDMFRRYNAANDIGIILAWIQERHSSLRLLSVMEYLEAIDEDELAAEIYFAIGLDAHPARDIRVLAIKLLRRLHRPEAITLANRLYQANLRDDSILEIYIDTLLTFERWGEAEGYLQSRLSSRVEGTAFHRQHAKVLAEKGDRDQAISIMEKITQRDYRLYRNTIAPAQKKALYLQYEQNQTFLNQLKGEENPVAEP